jgi:hypothetical protein
MLAYLATASIANAVTNRSERKKHAHTYRRVETLVSISTDEDSSGVARQCAYLRDRIMESLMTVFAVVGVTSDSACSFSLSLVSWAFCVRASFQCHSFTGSLARGKFRQGRFQHWHTEQFAKSQTRLVQL